MVEKKYEDADEDLNFWKPETNDFIAGIYLTKKTKFGENNANVYVLRQEDGTLISVWGSKVLDDKMSYRQEGEDIKIIYLGEKKGEGTRKYHDYKIQVSKTSHAKDPKESTDEQ